MAFFASKTLIAMFKSSVRLQEDETLWHFFVDCEFVQELIGYMREILRAGGSDCTGYMREILRAGGCACSGYVREILRAGGCDSTGYMREILRAGGCDCTGYMWEY